MPSKNETVQQNVKMLTELDPKVVVNYNRLILKYWEEFDGLNGTRQVEECTSSESITRAFRKMVRNGEIHVPEDIKKLRRKQREEFKQDYAANM